MKKFNMGNNKKIILVTGAGGYIGSELVGELLKKDYRVKALDRFFFGMEVLDKYLNNPDIEIIKEDIRYFPKEILKNVYAVIDLASISNDPACDLDPKITYSINYQGLIRTAKLSKEMGVKRYIFSSSCSVYGQGGNLQLDESSETSPVSLYAKLKIKTEEKLLSLADDNFWVTCPRNATVYGISKRMRFDLIINIMTLHAFKNKKVFVMGGGKQWRPLIHIQDLIRAFILILEADKKKINGEIFNVGSNEQNYQVYEVANSIKKIIPDIKIENVPSDIEKRNYNVNFSKIQKVLGFTPQKNIEDGIKEIKDALEKEEIIDDIKTKTVDYYRWLIETDKILQEVKYKNRIF